MLQKTTKMTVFLSTLNQTGFLFTLIFIGYILAKVGVVERSSARSLAKLENFVFVPALIIGSFVENFTVERLGSVWRLLVVCTLIALVSIPLSIIASKLLDRDKYAQNIYTYGLVFSNFGFMGNAVILAIYPEVFFEYTLFTFPLWIALYVWGIPVLLIPQEDGAVGIRSRLRSFVNPMFISMIIGIVLGLCGARLPEFLDSAISVSRECMSPVAMILTGITISTIDLKATFTRAKLYLASLIRLVAFPLIFILVARLLPLSELEYTLCVVMLAMPFGLNTIIVPEAYGRDTSLAAGLTLISSILACVTIPFVLTIM